MMDKAAHEVNPDVLLKKMGEKVIKRVPGEIPALGRMSHEAKKMEEEIRRMDLPSLRDLLERQEKILKNTKLIRTLPDKGEKIRKKKQVIEDLIQKRTAEVDAASDLLAGLTIGGEKLSSVEEMEFRFGSGLGTRHLQNASKNLDSDDEDEVEKDSLGVRNPLKVIAEKEVPKRSAKKQQHLPLVPEDSISEEDKQELAWERHSASLSSKVDHLAKAERYMPFHNLQHDRLAENDDKTTGRLKRNEKERGKVELMPLPETKATKGKTMLLTVEESLKIQLEQAEKMKEVNLRVAMERLTSSKGAVTAATSDARLRDFDKTAYRNPVQETDTEDLPDGGNEEGFGDEEEEGKVGGVGFTITEFEQE